MAETVELADIEATLSRLELEQGAFVGWARLVGAWRPAVAAPMRDKG